MRRRVAGTLILAIFGLALNSARAATADLSQWFFRATDFELALESGPGKRPAQNIAEPDFLGGKNSYGKQSCYVSNMSHDTRPLPFFAGNWHLIRYDRKHHIGLAAPHDDSDGCAIFSAPTPAATVPDADLSHFSTARGLRIGSAYTQVLSTYGPPKKYGRHFVTSYRTGVPGVTISLPHRTVKLPETITLVIDDDRVSSITIFINESGLV